METIITARRDRPASEKATAAPERARRCRHHDRRDNPCPNPALSEDETTIAICVKHAAEVIQLVAEAKAARLGLRRA